MVCNALGPMQSAYMQILHSWTVALYKLHYRLCAGLSQNDAQVHTFSETTAVQFGKLSDQETAAYIATGAALVTLVSMTISWNM